MQSVDECKELLDRGGYKMLDIRPWKAYDREHLTKPPQCTINAPLMDGDDPSVLLAKCENQGLRPAAKLLVADFDGERVQAAADALHAAGYENVVAVEGGYNGWRKVFTTCGRRRPPQGKWVSTGAGGESLKSGLTLDPNVAAAYEENWGKPPPKHGEKGESVAASQRPNPALAPVAMDADIVEARQRAIDNGHAASNGGAAISGAAEGSAWDTFFTDDANRTPYYVNRNTGEKRWEEPERWWSGGKWVDRG